MNIYAFDNYLSVLRFQLKDNAAEKGYHSKLARAAGMHLSYLTRVMKGEVHITPDHAAGIAELWRLGSEETDYFLNLVLRERASSSRLRNLLDLKLVNSRRVKDQSGRPSAQLSSIEKSAEYSSSWKYAATHISLSIPGLGSEAALCRHLRLPLEVVSSTLNRLEHMGLAKRQGNKWSQTSLDLIFLDSRTWHGEQFRRNWLHYRLNKVTPIADDEFTYAGPFSVSRADAKKIRRILKSAAEDSFGVIVPSHPEETYSLVLDWVRL